MRLEGADVKRLLKFVARGVFQISPNWVTMRPPAASTVDHRSIIGFARFATALVLVLGVAGAARQAHGEGPSQAPVITDKRTRTPAQQKIDSQLLQAIERARARPGAGRATGAEAPPLLVRIDSKGRALVDIRIKVTAETRALVRKHGGTVISSSTEHLSIIARVPLREIELLANDPRVTSIVPAAEATTNR